ncbi:DUF2807 domain-containing protein [Flavobacteriaceae bacterium F89]|uniref:DUF2807 domain-containing protein n=1 Tax=Cerina litoralis TaxID=2874477 RepID=A0AAE3EW62_9FLAO|nr:head GIN domain-containing protein [Cerina litoralis]MCG2460807.1 DUF2807 domain-containing protein [Cerina litoralis]
MKKSKIFIAIFLLTGFLVSAQETTKDLKKFTKVKVYDQIGVTLVKSSSNKAVISGDDQDQVEIVNKKGELKVKMRLGKMLAGKHTDVILYHTQDLESLDVNENAKISTKGSLEGKYLTLSAQEGGEIDVAVKAENVASKAITGGIIIVSGSATIQKIDINSGGSFDGRKLSNDQTTVKVLAGGNASVNSKKMVDAHVTAGGSIDIYGSPEKVDQDKALGGTITLH